MIHPDTELRFVDDVIGYGVFAKRFIPKGTITWARDDLDQTFSPAQVEKMARVYRDIIDKYTFVDGHGQFVLCWDLARYINHSCDPTSLSPGFDFEVAVRDVEPGEQLTDDYGTLNLEWSFRCRCGFAACRGEIGPDDLLRFADDWDDRVRRVFARIAELPQPLWHVVREKEAVERAIASPAAIPSCRAIYHPVSLRPAAP